MNYWRGVPSEVNRDFHKKRVDFAFISSITSRNSKCGNLGIIARDKVLSVLVLNGENRKDSASETSNHLASILNISGKVIIGDKALHHYFQSGTGKDLAQIWKDKYKSPFVFAKLCFHKREKILKKLENLFKKEKTHIPHYILKREMSRVGLTRNEILFYLSKIDYFCDYKSRKGFHKFTSLANRI
jgi:chorismate dehydratase